MLARIENFFRRLRRNLSRSVWLARLLRLPVSEGPPSRPGLVMIQIDGLSRPQFERALAHGELPFLRRLIQQEHYRPCSLYSGLPSTTPAVQAELFYGIQSAVPAFAFRDKATGEIVRMYEPDVAARYEALCADSGNPALLEGGSAYADNFTGGAAESHFCPASMGWGPALRAANPFVLLAFLLSNLYSFVRIAVLLLLELGIALVDFVRGLIRGQDFFKELKFVPTRVAISILLRELCVIGGKIDIARGLPIIHINFLGYDEQSHRRGPRSLFAHWTLKGIDDAVARLWRAAGHAAWRHYDVWIYSDHGQAQVRSYHALQGYGIEAAIGAAFDKLHPPGPRADSASHSMQTHRVRLLGGKKTQRLFSVLGGNGDRGDEQKTRIAALGPVAHVYTSGEPNDALRTQVAHELATTHQVPVVLARDDAGALHAWTETGQFRIPLDVDRLFGAQHPFIDALGADLLRLCEHPDAGDLVLLGWRDGLAPITFATENGAHAGLTPDETHGFALLPEDAQLAARERRYLRPLDLRHAALHQLGRQRPAADRTRRRPVAVPTDDLRIMTYNVHSCVGMDGKLDAERVARVIARAKPDVVALQELDVGRLRSQSMDQAHLIARYLEMDFHFHPALHLEEERYGDAILTHLPLRLVKAGPLPGLADKPRLEPRGVLWVAVDLHGTEVQIINTHLGLYPRERLAQVEALLGQDWLAHPDCRDPVILCGDFNAMPSSPVCRHFGKRLRDAQTIAPGHRPKATFSSRFPSLRIDHIFIGEGIEVSGIQIPRSQLARIASDHLPLLAELRVARQSEIAAGAGFARPVDAPEDSDR